jgi:hypothetical protein
MTTPSVPSLQMNGVVNSYQGLRIATHKGGFPDAGVIWFKNGERRRFAMPIELRSDFDAAFVRRAARESANANQVRRLLALAAIYDGSTRTEAAEIGGVTLQIVRRDS